MNQKRTTGRSSRKAETKPRRTAMSQKDLKIMQKVVKRREGLYRELAKH